MIRIHDNLGLLSEEQSLIALTKQEGKRAKWSAAGQS